MFLRVLSALIGAPLFLYIIYLGGIPLTILVGLLVFAAAYEIRKMAEGAVHLHLVFVPAASMVLILALVYSRLDLAAGVLGLAVPGAFLLCFLRGLLPDKLIQELELNIFSILYLSLFGFILLLRNMPGGFKLTLLSLLIIWGYDIGAYFTGLRFGKRRPWPKISPLKSVEGVMGGLASSVLLAVLVSSYVGIDLFPALLLGVLGALFTQAGDLAESALKRNFGVKDAGYIIPGHGGVLDRFDGLLFAMPVIYFLLLISQNAL